MKSKTDKFVRWAPRILAILFILFLAMFSLDVFEPGRGFWETAVALFMHNLPALFLAAVLVAAWRREIIGGIVFILAGLLYAAMIAAKALQGNFEWYMLSWILTIAGPAFLVGILFIVSWQQRKRRGN